MKTMMKNKCILDRKIDENLEAIFELGTTNLTNAVLNNHSLKKSFSIINSGLSTVTPNIDIERFNKDITILYNTVVKNFAEEATIMHISVVNSKAKYGTISKMNKVLMAVVNDREWIEDTSHEVHYKALGYVMEYIDHAFKDFL